MNEHRECILVLGMHRSGTSAFCSLLNASGLKYGKSLMPPSFDNPKGFFENLKITRLNDELLHVLGSKWDSPKSPFALSIDQPIPSEFYQRGMNLIHEEFSDDSLFFIKDPRMCYTLPFWKKVLNELSITFKYVVVLRNPNEIVESLKRRNGFANSKSILLIASYLLSADSFTRDAPRSLVLFDDVIRNPDRVISSLNHELNYQIKLSSSSVPIDKELRHFRNETIKVNHALLKYVERTFELLSDNKIHHNIELDEITQNHFKIIDTLILPWIEELHFVKVLFYGEDDYNESDSINLLVENNTLSSTIDIKNSKTRKVNMIVR